MTSRKINNQLQSLLDLDSKCIENKKVYISFSNVMDIKSNNNICFDKNSIFYWISFQTHHITKKKQKKQYVFTFETIEDILKLSTSEHFTNFVISTSDNWSNACDIALFSPHYVRSCLNSDGTLNIHKFEIGFEHITKKPKKSISEYFKLKAPCLSVQFRKVSIPTSIHTENVTIQPTTHDSSRNVFTKKRCITGKFSKFTTILFDKNSIDSELDTIELTREKTKNFKAFHTLQLICERFFSEFFDHMQCSSRNLTTTITLCVFELISKCYVQLLNSVNYSNDKGNQTKIITINHALMNIFQAQPFYCEYGTNLKMTDDEILAQVKDKFKSIYSVSKTRKNVESCNIDNHMESVAREIINIQHNTLIKEKMQNNDLSMYKFCKIYMDHNNTPCVSIISPCIQKQACMDLWLISIKSCYALMTTALIYKSLETTCSYENWYRRALECENFLLDRNMYNSFKFESKEFVYILEFFFIEEYYLNGKNSKLKFKPESYWYILTENHQTTNQQTILCSMCTCAIDTFVHQKVTCNQMHSFHAHCICEANNNSLQNWSCPSCDLYNSLDMLLV